MPRYHFVVRAPDHTHDDPDGMHLPNHEAATEQAHRIVRELTEDGYRPGTPLTRSRFERLIVSTKSPLTPT